MAFYVSVQTFRRRLLLLLSLFAMHYFLEALMEEMITFKGSIIQAPSTPPGIQPSCLFSVQHLQKTKVGHPECATP